MRWVTKAAFHVDRVTCPWLISKFVDKDAVFGFLSREDSIPPWGGGNRWRRDRIAESVLHGPL
ncbi:chromate resistance protein [Candidatus Bathyarchaeota archaeon]|nr:chromate resistance protein [Candidatus Bathyarchaeota archaeon]